MRFAYAFDEHWQVAGAGFLVDDFTQEEGAAAFGVPVGTRVQFGAVLNEGHPLAQDGAKGRILRALACMGEISDHPINRGCSFRNDFFYAASQVVRADGGRFYWAHRGNLGCSLYDPDGHGNDPYRWYQSLGGERLSLAGEQITIFYAWDGESLMTRLRFDD